MAADADTPLVPLEPGPKLWEQVFVVAPLIVVGTREPDGTYDFAPKHMATPMSWAEHFGFVCTPKHATYQNTLREGCFTVSYLRPDQVVLASLAAAPRCNDAHKHAVDALPQFAASNVDGRLIQHGYLHLECELDRMVDDLGPNSLVIGRVVAAHAEEDAVREPDRDDEDLLLESPMLAYLHPGRFARVAQTYSFPYHAGWRR